MCGPFTAGCLRLSHAFHLQSTPGHLAGAQKFACFIHHSGKEGEYLAKLSAAGHALVSRPHQKAAVEYLIAQLAHL